MKIKCALNVLIGGILIVIIFITCIVVKTILNTPNPKTGVLTQNYPFVLNHNIQYILKIDSCGYEGVKEVSEKAHFLLKIGDTVNLNQIN